MQKYSAFSKILIIAFISLPLSAQKIPRENNGQVEVEAENFTAQTKDNLRKWVVVKDQHAASASGRA